MFRYPAEHRWSSFSCIAPGKADSFISPQALYLRLGHTSGERQENYMRLFDVAIDQVDVQRINTAAILSMPPGNSRFKEQTEHALIRKIVYEHQGRPRKAQRRDK